MPNGKKKKEKPSIPAIPVPINVLLGARLDRTALQLLLYAHHAVFHTRSTH